MSGAVDDTTAQSLGRMAGTMNHGQAAKIIRESKTILLIENSVYYCVPNRRK